MVLVILAYFQEAYHVAFWKTNTVCGSKFSSERLIPTTKILLMCGLLVSRFTTYECLALIRIIYKRIYDIKKNVKRHNISISYRTMFDRYCLKVLTFSHKTIYIIHDCIIFIYSSEKDDKGHFINKII